jgi:hypothetical protein
MRTEHGFLEQKLHLNQLNLGSVLTHETCSVWKLMVGLQRMAIIDRAGRQTDGAVWPVTKKLDREAQFLPKLLDCPCGKLQ